MTISERDRLESSIETTFLNRMSPLGVLCMKAEGLGKGWPDRILISHDARVAFVELKKKGKKPEPAQKGVHRKLRSRGFSVFLVDCIADIDDVAEWVKYA